MLYICIYVIQKIQIDQSYATASIILQFVIKQIFQRAGTVVSEKIIPH